MGNAASVALAVGIPLVGGMAGSFATQKEVNNWYKTIKKPKWNPPNWLFGPVWSVLYTTMGVASWLVWKNGKPNRVVPLTLYGIQLALNFAFTPLLFKAHKIDAALVDITALLGVATAATITMAKTSNAGAVTGLMVPYLAWVSFATVLTGKLWQLNPEDENRLIKKNKVADKVETGAEKTQAAAQEVKQEVKQAATKAD